MPQQIQDAVRPRRFLFLQGPITPFFDEVGAELRRLGHGVHRINFCLGDKLAWRSPGAEDFTARPETWPAFIAAFLDRHAITDIVLLGEQRFYHREAIAAAKARGLTVVATDFGYLRPDWITFELDGMNRESRFPREPEAVVALAETLPPLDLAQRHRDSFLNQATWDVAYHLANLIPGPFRHYASHQIYHPVQVYLGTLLRLIMRRRANRRSDAIIGRLKQEGRPLFLMAMQMETDFSVRAYSRYPDLDTAIEEVITSFAAHAPPAAQLLVKVHPLDPAVKNWGRRVARTARRAGVAGRVHYLGGGNLGSITESVQGVVTINSTVGLRAIVDRLPTLALGDAIYKIPGLTHGGSLDSFWTEGHPPDPVLREAFLRGIGHCLHIRGVYYARPGLDAAVEAAAHRLHHGLVNQPVLEPPPLSF
ncbi:capsule biosynthesis protein [Muricoccus aerilatus]|uniref:capsule biosynthesis protein n=1 Tax=Muricoccus aerilatus TaxID=452982 RepID=UPI0005C23597|nr:capsular biosynthesis protein [Roseomonas aerilata]